MLTGRLAGLRSRAAASETSSQSALQDTDMADAEDAGPPSSTAGAQASKPQLTPRTLFPNVRGQQAGSSKTAADNVLGVKQGGFSSKLVGTSSHVPSLATFVNRPHDVAPAGEFCNRRL
jgi:hypothetical protein